jgi:hypothetical protein
LETPFYLIVTATSLEDSQGTIWPFILNIHCNTQNFFLFMCGLQ